MSKKYLSKDNLTRPENFLAELLISSARGSIVEHGDNTQILHRAVVVAVDVNGGKLENATGSGLLTHILNGKSIEVKANIGPDNPRNSIKARILTDSYDKFFATDDLRVYWPLFPEHIMLPIKPGEHVYIMFEDENREHGLWFCKIPGHENVNFYDGKKSYKRDNASLASKFGDEPEEEELTDGEVNERHGLENNLKNILP